MEPTTNNNPTNEPEAPEFEARVQTLSVGSPQSFNRNQRAPLCANPRVGGIE
jgi:hypothetical protein